MNYRLAPGISIEEQTDGGMLVAARPLRLVRLNPPLLRLIRRLQAGSVTPASAAERKVLETLAKRGFVSREWPPLDAAELPQVSVVIPVKDRPDDLRNCLTSLAALDYPKEKLEIIVVDDGSTDDTPQVALKLGATLVASGAIGGGPAVARNKGAAVAKGAILAFIDSDCTASEQWLRELLPAFSEPGVAAVGGYVDGMHAAAPLDRYEAVMSSLNLGRRAMSGGAGEDTFYLPSCNLLLRRDVFVAAGGFRSELQVGEDVDLTWRLRDGAWTIVYLPQGTVCHAHRSRLWPFMKRRFDYGTSEGLLQRLHPVRGKKMLLPPMLTAPLALLALAVVGRSFWPLLPALLLLLVDTLVTTRRIRRQGIRLAAGRVLAARGRALASLGYYTGYHLLRYYLVPLLLVALGLPAARPAPRHRPARSGDGRSPSAAGAAAAAAVLGVLPARTGRLRQRGVCRLPAGEELCQLSAAPARRGLTRAGMKVLVCIDDTDSPESRGTGELATELAAAIETRGWGRSSFVSRHQLLVHPAIPYTSHNSAMCFGALLDAGCLSRFVEHAARFLVREAASGSDPGLCIVRSEQLPQPGRLIAFGQAAKREVLTKQQAFALAGELGVHLAELGGSGAGVIGALAGAGLRLSGCDGRLRGELHFNAAGEVLSVAELCAHPFVERVQGLDGRALGPLERIRLGGKPKAVLKAGRSVLLVTPLAADAEGAGWQTCHRQVLKSF